MYPGGRVWEGPPFMRSPYNYDMNTAGNEDAIHCTDVSLAKQSFAEECDINTIVRKFGVTGELPTNIRMPSYGDFTGLNSFHEAMNAVAAAHESFDQMPAEVRARFHNNPQEFIEFCDNPANMAEARKLGLVPEAEIAAAAALTTPPAGGTPAASAPADQQPT